MPTYEYTCAKCDHHFETVQSIMAKPLSICPKDLCAQKRWGKGRVRRAIVSGAGLIFKGSGFYETDYRSENYKEGAKKEAPATATPAADSKAGDAKPAAGKVADTKAAPAKPAEAKSAPAPSSSPSKPIK